MIDTRVEADHYLAARRALGFKLANEACLLSSFVDYLEARGATRVTIELAVAWATQPQNTDPSYWGQRLSVVRVFARYLQSLDPTVEVPPAGLLPGRGRYRPDPYLYSEADVVALLVAGNALSPGLRAATCTTIIGLLAVTGMRVGEAIALDRDDVDLDHGWLRVRNAKFGKARQLPVHASTVKALRSYTVVRDSAYPRASANFFCTTKGNRPAYWNIYPDFRQLLRDSGLESSGDRRRPRLHDLRHVFAVQTLLGWYRDGADIQPRLPLLSTYLGHVNPVHTYHYLTATPELLGQVVQRLEHTWGRPS